MAEMVLNREATAKWRSSSKHWQPAATSRQLHLLSAPATVTMRPSVPMRLTRLMRRESDSATYKSPFGPNAKLWGITSDDWVASEVSTDPPVAAASLAPDGNGADEDMSGQ